MKTFKYIAVAMLMTAAGLSGAGSGLNGQPCNGDYNCASGHCCDGVCQECCTANSDCPSGKPICSENKCMDKLPNDKACKGDYDCKSGHCCDGTCKECCYSDRDCDGKGVRKNRCFNNKCVSDFQAFHPE